ncbi:unnamed protein product [Chrysodeixis includens]|uniref:Uncharacterized protein n=1 Tax=Chrysodeixis includens TaxID=689277 RepID=A0A9N8Q0C9_CHRIL|nr:unnamed protein product [Chrysodeixis includens]
MHPRLVSDYNATEAAEISSARIGRTEPSGAGAAAAQCAPRESGVAATSAARAHTRAPRLQCRGELAHTEHATCRNSLQFINEKFRDISVTIQGFGCHKCYPRAERSVTKTVINNFALVSYALRYDSRLAARPAIPNKVAISIPFMPISN